MELLDYLVYITALSELEAQAFFYTSINSANHGYVTNTIWFDLTLKNLKYKIYFDWFHTFFSYYMIPYVFFHSFDVFTIILQCRK